MEYFEIYSILFSPCIFSHFNMLLEGQAGKYLYQGSNLNGNILDGSYIKGWKIFPGENNIIIEGTRDRWLLKKTESSF